MKSFELVQRQADKEKNPKKAKAITILKDFFWIWSKSDFSKW